MDSKSGRKKSHSKSKKDTQSQSNPSHSQLDLNFQMQPNSQNFSQHQNYAMHNIGSPYQINQPYPRQNLSFSNPSSFTQFPPNSIENFQYSQSDTIFPMSQHFQSLEGGESLPNFGTSLRSRAASIKGDDDDDEKDQIEDNDDEDGDPQAEKAARHFWLHAEEQVLVNSWLQVSQDKYVGSNHKGNTFWNKVFDKFDQVRRYRNICWAKRVQGIRESDLLKEREMEALRSRWKRIDASVSKFVGAYAHAEARTSGQCDDDVMKIALTIYKSDSKNHKDFQYQHCWEILRGSDPWKPVGSIVKKCKKKTTTQEGGGSKRSRINEDDNFSTSTNPNTPTSGDIGCFIQPPSDGSVKNKGKGKVMNMPPDALQQWVDYSVSKMNLSRTSETQTELARLKYDRDVESERVQREREKILVKQRKINMELFKVLSSKAYLTEDEEELKNNLVKVLFPG